MDAAIIGRIALETAIPESAVAAAAALFESGAAGPFVVHYRKEATGGLDEAKIRSIQERIAYYKEIWDQRAALLKMLSEQEKLTEELRTRIEGCFAKAELDDLHHQFRPRRKTRAIDAAEKGLEPLAEYFWNQELDAWSVEEHIDVFVDPAKGISTREQALQGVVDIIAEWIWENIEYRKKLRDMLWSEGALISSVVPAKVGQKTKYNMYYDRRESVTTIPSHRVLAIRRGCKEGILISSIEGDNSKALEFLLNSIIKDKESIFAPVLEAAVRESYNRLLRPLIETEVRTQLKERADREAIKVFQENLANLLLSPPAGPIVVMGIDYGKGGECNAAVIDEAGKFLERAKIRFASDSKASPTRGKKQPEAPSDSGSPKEKTQSEKNKQKSEIPSTDSKPAEVEAQPDAENSAPAQAEPSEPSSPDTASSVSSSPGDDAEKNPEQPSETNAAQGEAETQSGAEASAPTQEQPSEEPAIESASSDSSALEEHKEKNPEQSPATDAPQTEESKASPVADSATIADPPSTESLKTSDLGIEPQTPEIKPEPKEASQAENDKATADASGSDTPDAPVGETISPAIEDEAAQSQPAVSDSAATDIESPKPADKAATDGTAPAEETVESAPQAPDSALETTESAPETTESAPETTESAPETTESAPETTESAPETTESAPETAKSAPETTESAPAPEPKIEDPGKVLKALIAKHNIKAISIGIGAGSRELEATLRQIVQEDKLGDIIIAAVNDAGIAIYSSSRIAREEFPDWNASARCAVSLARRLQDPLAELVKIDPKLIGVGQYQHDVDQKALHRGLLQTVQYCVNKVGVNVNTASESLLRYVSGLNDKLARRLVAHRTTKGSFKSRASIMEAVGMDEFNYQQSAAFLRIPDGENPLDRTAVHPESYPIVEKMRAALDVEIDKLIENKELISSLKLEDFVTETTGIPTLKDIREELLRPGRDPRKAFRVPKFRADVKEMSDLKPGMALEGTVTNVTNFGAFVDIGVRQDGLVHLSQMSNRFIRDPREAVKVGDVVQVKVISVESETKRIGLSMKAMLPTAQRRRKKQRRNARRPAQGSQSEEKSGGGSSTGDAAASASGSGRHQKSNRPYQGSSRNRRRGGRKAGNPDGSQQQKGSDSKTPEPTLQEKIAILQSKFRRIN